MKVKIMLHLNDIIKNPYLVLFLSYKYIFFIFLGIKTKPFKKLDIIEPLLSKSFIRWGDGETNSALGISFSFEKSSYKLKKTLNEILKNTRNDIIIGLPLQFINKEEKVTEYINIWKTTRIYFALFLNQNRQYSDSFFFREIGTKQAFLNFYKGKEIFLVLNHDTFNKVNSSDFNIVGNYTIPFRNSFDQYDTIKSNVIKEIDKIKNINKNNFVIIVSGGPFAKVLCYDLTVGKNYVCHDVGAVFDIYF